MFLYYSSEHDWRSSEFSAQRHLGGEILQLPRFFQMTSELSSSRFLSFPREILVLKLFSPAIRRARPNLWDCEPNAALSANCVSISTDSILSLVDRRFSYLKLSFLLVIIFVLTLYQQRTSVDLIYFRIFYLLRS